MFGVLLVDSEDERVRAWRLAALLFLMRVAVASCIFLASLDSFFLLSSFFIATRVVCAHLRYILFLFATYY